MRWGRGQWGLEAVILMVCPISPASPHPRHPGGWGLVGGQTPLSAALPAGRSSWVRGSFAEGGVLRCRRTVGCREPTGKSALEHRSFRETLDREKGERQRGVTAATPACEVTGNNLTRVRVGISAHACVRRMYEVTGCEVSYTWG